MFNNPPNSEISKLLKLFDDDDMHKVIDSCNRYIKQFEKSPLLFNIMGSAHYRLRNFSKSLEYFKKALNLNPNYDDAYFNIANSYGELGDYLNSEENYKRAIECNSSFYEAYNNLGVLQRNAGEIDKSIKSFSSAVNINTDFFEGFNNLGISLQLINYHDDAIKCFTRATELNKNFTEAFFNLGNVYRELQKFSDAEQAYEKCLTLNPSQYEAMSNLGFVLTKKRNIDRAIKILENALLLKPNFPNAYSNLSFAYREIGRLDDAISCCQKSILIDHNHIDSHWNMSLALLSKGSFAEGWKEYEYGRLMENQRRSFPKTSKEWNGEMLNGKSLLITAEQGVGDEIMFASCFSNFQKYDSVEITVECDKRLIPIFKRSFQSFKFLERTYQRTKDEWNDLISDYDFVIPAGSLPRFFRNSITCFEDNKAYLKPDSMLQKKWKKRFNLIGKKPKVGIAWAGGVKNSEKQLETPSLEKWLEILKRDCHLINIQYGDHSEELSQLKDNNGIDIHHWDDVDPLTNLEDHFAQISELDLVISYSNSAIHVAGSVGIKSWVLLPFSPDFRWLFNENKSIWYDNMKAYRQEKFGDWSQAFYSLEEDLDSLLNQLKNTG